MRQSIRHLSSKLDRHIRICVFKYFNSKTPVEWINKVVANNGEFEIKLNSESRLCAFIGEESISMIEYGKSFELLNKTVKVINQPQLDNSSISDIQVVVIK